MSAVWIVARTQARNALRQPKAVRSLLVMPVLLSLVVIVLPALTDQALERTRTTPTVAVERAAPAVAGVRSVAVADAAAAVLAGDADVGVRSGEAGVEVLYLASRDRSRLAAGTVEAALDEQASAAARETQQRSGLDPDAFEVVAVGSLDISGTPLEGQLRLARLLPPFLLLGLFLAMRPAQHLLRPPARSAQLEGLLALPMDRVHLATGSWLAACTLAGTAGVAIVVVAAGALALGGISGATATRAVVLFGLAATLAAVQVAGLAIVIGARARSEQELGRAQLLLVPLIVVLFFALAFLPITELRPAVIAVPVLGPAFGGTAALAGSLTVVGVIAMAVSTGVILAALLVVAGRSLDSERAVLGAGAS